MRRVDEDLRELFRRLLDGRQPWPLLLSGRCGCGKTCAVLALCDFARRSFYATVEELCRVELYGTLERKRLTWRKVEESPLAVLDEIGIRQKVTDLEFTVAYRFADLRDRRRGAGTVYVSNFSPEAIGRLYDDRLLDRISRGTFYRPDGPSKRRSAP
jgi:DNA replication protein DnaC